MGSGEGSCRNSVCGERKSMSEVGVRLGAQGTTCAHVWGKEQGVGDYWGIAVGITILL